MTVISAAHRFAAPARTVVPPQPQRRRGLRLPRQAWIRLPRWRPAYLRSRLAVAEAERDRAFTILREIASWYAPEATYA